MRISYKQVAHISKTKWRIFFIHMAHSSVTQWRISYKHVPHIFKTKWLIFFTQVAHCSVTQWVISYKHLALISKTKWWTFFTHVAHSFETKWWILFWHTASKQNIGYQNVCPFIGIWSPHPLPLCEDVYPLLPKGGGEATLPRGWWGWGNQFGRLERKPGTLYTLCMALNKMVISCKHVAHSSKTKNDIFL